MTMALFSDESKAPLPLLRELAVDFETGQPIRDGQGSFRTVTGREAVRVWIWRALQPENIRFAYSAHTDSYGNSLLRLVGCALPEAESRLVRMIRETLEVCPYIRRVERFSFEKQGSALKTAFTVVTVYGTVKAESEAIL